MKLVLSLTALLMSICVYITVSSLKSSSHIRQVNLGTGVISEGDVYGEELDMEDSGDPKSSEGKAGSSDGKAAAANSNTAQRPGRKKVPIVVIDAGHGGYDVGSIGPGGSLEKNNTLPVALKLGDILQKKGMKVVYTRKSDKVSWPASVKSDLQARAEISNAANANIFISIHNNSTTYTSVRGTETYYIQGSLKGKQLASLIQKQIVKKVGTNDRGIRTENFSVLRNVTAPAVLVELGYLSNANEEYILGNAGYQQKFAEAIAEAVIEYFKHN
jgi:N-acetylmuramoyl-L-alanine amidase